MPFDVAQQPGRNEVDIVDVLQLARTLIDKGWTRKQMSTHTAYGYQYCAVGAYRTAYRVYYNVDEPNAVIDRIFAPRLCKHIPISLGYLMLFCCVQKRNRLMIFNDYIAKHKEAVLQLFDQAIAKEYSKVQ